jgi:hypothetical protein
MLAFYMLELGIGDTGRIIAPSRHLGITVPGTLVASGREYSLPESTIMSDTCEQISAVRSSSSMVDKCTCSKSLQPAGFTQLC